MKTKRVEVEVNVELLREQRSALGDLKWTADNIHHLYGLQRMISAMISAPVAESAFKVPKRAPKPASPKAPERETITITGFSEEETAEYRRQLEDKFDVIERD